MKKVQHAYVNTPHLRVITAADFRSLGVEDQERAVWEPKNGHVVEVSDEAAAKLLEVEPGEWRVVDGDPSSDGAPFEPLGSGEDDDETVGTSAASRTSRRRTSSSS